MTTAHNYFSELVSFSCVGDAACVRTLWHLENVGAAVGDVNAPRFGAYQEPLLCALARAMPRRNAMYLDAICAFFVAEAGADPNRPNAAGETPLALAIGSACLWHNHSPCVTPAAVQRLAVAIGGAAEASAFERGVLLRHALREGRLPLLAPLAPRLAPKAPGDGVMHFLARTRADAPEELVLKYARLLLDDYGQDPFERDAEDRTLAELPSTRPALRELLADASARFVAVGLALHPRLGADSPLHALDAELLRDLVLPHCRAQPRIRETRLARFNAFAEAEGLRLPGVRREYAEDGAPFDAPSFRFVQFKAHDLPYDLHLPLLRAAPDLDWFRRRGVRFDMPYSSAYARHAAAAAREALPPTDENA